MKISLHRTALQILSLVFFHRSFHLLFIIAQAFQIYLFSYQYQLKEETSLRAKWYVFSHWKLFIFQNFLPSIVKWTIASDKEWVILVFKVLFQGDLICLSGLIVNNLTLLYLLLKSLMRLPQHLDFLKNQIPTLIVRTIFYLCLDYMHKSEEITLIFL
jgi:hypothetical protein